MSGDNPDAEKAPVSAHDGFYVSAGNRRWRRIPPEHAVMTTRAEDFLHGIVRPRRYPDLWALYAASIANCGCCASRIRHIPLYSGLYETGH